MIGGASRCAGAGLALLAVLPVLGCGDHAPDARPAHTSLGGEVVARVADLDIPASAVVAVAAARRVGRDRALALLVDDAVAAKGAVGRGLDRAPDVRVASTAAKARAALDRAGADARRSPPTDEEVRALTAEHWVDADRPETFVVIHAIALRPKKPDAAAEAAAKAVAAQIAAAEVGAVDEADFVARAKAVPAGSTEVTVERLDPFALDGRVATTGVARSYDPRFAAGAGSLAAPGSTSGVVEGAFGWHVLRLIERFPPLVLPLEERRQMFADEVYVHRASDAIAKLSADQRSREPVVLANGLDDLLAEAALAMHTAPAPLPPQ